MPLASFDSYEMLGFFSASSQLSVQSQSIGIIWIALERLSDACSGKRIFSHIRIGQRQQLIACRCFRINGNAQFQNLPGLAFPANAQENIPDVELGAWARSYG